MLKIVTLPDPRLRTKSVPLDPEKLKTDEYKKIIAEMTDLMYKSDGVGIAAPQIGINKRFCIIGKLGIEKDKKSGVKVADLVLINPTWTKISRKKNSEVEGCLSVPHTFGTVSRLSEIRVHAFDLDGRPLEFIAHGYFARVIQHEVDHLDGILFIDRATGVYND
ncbi:MAG TPA: peptide deformylase [Candidatus Magasanikbacteria bacterium]|nr:peptide deformylase [Candidatus Magasanikbacteria bacterium]